MNFNTELLASFSKTIEHVVSRVVVTPSVGVFGTDLIGDNPFLEAQINWNLDSQTPQNILITMDDLILLENLRLGQDSLIGQVDRIALDRQLKVFEDLLLHEESNSFIDLLHLLSWVSSTNCKAVAHVHRARSDALRDAIDTTKFRHQMNHAVTMLYYQERLIEISDSQAKLVVHVLCHSNLSVVVDELLGHWIGAEVHIAHDVGTFVAPVSNDARANDRRYDELLEALLTRSLLAQLLDFIEYGDSAHESEDGIDSHCETLLCVVDRGLEARQDL